jgi:transcriptional regulator with XRE-family HTH domain
MVRLRVREVAEEKGLSMAKLARRADIDYKTVQRIYRDPYREVTTTTLGKLADALGVPVTELLESVEEDRKKST